MTVQKKEQDLAEGGRKVERREFLKMAAAGTALFGLAGCSLFEEQGMANQKKPNIIVLFADDQGWGELGIQGEKTIPTPNIDSIGQNGVRFTQGYVTCPVCSPSRVGLLTGRYQNRFGMEDFPMNNGIPQDEPTLATRLKGLGYSTGMIGKWHVGEKEPFRPTDHGFQEFFGFYGGAHFFLLDKERTEQEKKGPMSGPLRRGTDPVKESGYLTDVFGREAVSFIDRHQSEPFFLYVAFNAVHTPLESTDEYMESFPEITNQMRRAYAGMTAAMDQAVGNILATLRKYGLEEDTLIFYASDNGGYIWNTSQNGPLREGKGYLYEGGIRVPFLMQWKGMVPAGTVYDNPVISLDISATALAVAGGSMPTEKKLDGVNIMPHVLAKAAGRPHETLYWRFIDKRAFRKGDWKIVQDDYDKATELFNLADDMEEKKDLAKAMPDKLKEMEEAFRQMNGQMMDPVGYHLMTAARFKKEGKPWPPKVYK